MEAIINYLEQIKEKNKGGLRQEIKEDIYTKVINNNEESES